MSVGLSIDETGLLAEAEAALPAVVQSLYSDQLRGGSLREGDGRRFFVLNDSAGGRIELRLDTAALP
jgi:hypothetical protein